MLFKSKDDSVKWKYSLSKTFDLQALIKLFKRKKK